MWWGDSLTAYFFCVCFSSLPFPFSLNQMLLSKAFIFVEFCIGPCARHSKRDSRRLYNSLGCQKYYHGEQESLKHMWLLGGIPRAWGSATYMAHIDTSWAPQEVYYDGAMRLHKQNIIGGGYNIMSATRSKRPCRRGSGQYKYQNISTIQVILKMQYYNNRLFIPMHLICLTRRLQHPAWKRCVLLAR